MARSLLNVPVNGFAIIHGIVKVIAMICGLALSQICLMAAVGIFTESGWIRALVGLAANLLIPLAFADRVLPSDPKKSKGLATDALALIWLGFPFVFAVLALPHTSFALDKEAARLSSIGLNNTAKLTRLLAGRWTIAPELLTASTAPWGSAAASSNLSASVAAESAPTAVNSNVNPAASVKPMASASVNPSASASMSTTPPTSAAPPQNLSKSVPSAKTPAQLFKELSPSVVTVGLSSPLGITSGGTGFLIDNKGTIVTNHHVIAGGKQIEIKFVNGTIFNKADLLADDADRDLTLLRVDLDSPDKGPEVEATALKLGDSEDVEVGEGAIAIGNPLGLEHTLTDGLVSARRMYMAKPWIQMSVPVSPGNSGGPLFNMKGEVIGVVTAQIMKGGRAQNLNLAVPINALKKMIRSEYPKRRVFGTPDESGQW